MWMACKYPCDGDDRLMPIQRGLRGVPFVVISSSHWGWSYGPSPKPRGRHTPIESPTPFPTHPPMRHPYTHMKSSAQAGENSGEIIQPWPPRVLPTPPYRETLATPPSSPYRGGVKTLCKGVRFPSLSGTSGWGFTILTHTVSDRSRPRPTATVQLPNILAVLPILPRRWT
jgi:hypothetical protein